MSYFPVYRFKLLTVPTPWCIKLNKKHSFEVQYIYKAAHVHVKCCSVQMFLDIIIFTPLNDK